ncbi:hypothetical protein [Actinacidiphila glaucinigra]|uniref:Uncharacterized protein n=1 Tax=Actinacidiphila glaucinigra TaxID=235986 RepID=A0A239NTH7_9ACTN|nr:hypothetical protein [Actinacidiphila glaucinigra]SNT57753.1 hypothetical protein SAMN05216252_14622 [Actinacidiphila glaucinigra]
MSITAQLRDSVGLPGGGALVHGFALDSRGGGACRVLLGDGRELAVHDLDELFAGERAPSAVFPLPWPGWDRGVHSVSPDGTFAVFSGQRAVRAVGRGGETLWEYRHACWGPAIGHPHTGDEQEVCPGNEHGSCRVSEDGRFVWAHVVVEPADDEWEERWVVLDARDGRELARLPLDSAASGSHQLSHPDGVHMGLCIGMGQDGVLLHWARQDGGELTGWDLNEGMDRILMDVHEGHPGFLTVEHSGWNLQVHALDGTVLAEMSPESADDEDPPRWDYGCGFVDADTVIASTTDSAEEPEQARHWLLHARTLEIRGAVAYPTGPVDGYVRPLGDGTWLTWDDKSGTLNRWAATTL